MSQRLLVCKKENITEDDQFYDCIYTEDSNYEQLIYDWCNYHKETGGYFGAWKMEIRDRELIDKLRNDFVELRKICPMVPPLEDFLDE